jgi:hypothetical protein
MPAAVATISELLTWTQICETYPDSWVCLADVEWGRPDAFDPRGGRIIATARTRGELADKTRDAETRHGMVGRYCTSVLEVIMLNPRWVR